MSAKSRGWEAYIMPLKELIKATLPLESTPFRALAFRSPHCAPMPGISMGCFGHNALTDFNWSVTVAPTTRPMLLL